MREYGLDKSDVGGFAQVPHWLLEAIENPVTLRVWCYLHQHAMTVGEAFPSIERLATLSRISVATVRRSLNELQALGAVEIRHRFDQVTGRQQSNMFYLRMAHPSTRNDVLMVTDMTAEGVAPMTPSLATGERGEAVTGDTQNKNHSEEEQQQQQAVAGMLQVAALGKRDPSQLFDAEDWWMGHKDPLVRAWVDALRQIPKFAQHGTPRAELVERMVVDVRALAPDDAAVQYEMGTWVTYNNAQPKRGGSKDALTAFRNWCKNRAGAWQLEKDRRKNRQAGNRKHPGTDPLADHERLMQNGVEEPFR